MIFNTKAEKIQKAYDKIKIKKLDVIQDDQGA